MSSAASSGSESTPAASGADPEVPELPQTFRLSKLAYFAVPMAFLVALVLAGASLPWLGWTLILPVFLALWIARIRTVVTEDGLRAVSTFSARDVSWPEIEGLQFTKWGPVRAVLADDTRVKLPTITFQDLPRLSAASRGRIPDPYASADAAR
ncbi:MULTISPECIES: PH domain-containing protein [Gordonia]|uniref:PH domain-containing protein n=1 Tax=Gordonia TaxID=2053 RepID=UPI001FD58567|nr:MULTISPECIES: PH domain-containing protein [Gordonia]WLP90133.1 PH domain-containing protein [Gordonia sp. NB41Y]